MINIFREIIKGEGLLSMACENVLRLFPVVTLLFHSKKSKITKN